MLDQAYGFGREVGEQLSDESSASRAEQLEAIAFAMTGAAVTSASRGSTSRANGALLSRIGGLAGQIG